MGGAGSGNWYRWQKKSTVEESLSLGMKDIRKRLYAGATGTFTWTSSGGHKSSIGYFVTRSDEWPTVTLHYRWNSKDDISIPVRLEPMPMQFGGQRWWFICPIIVNDIPCNRRVGKLYSPPGAKYFGCRKCHQLTYRSCQEAHQTERLFGRLGMDFDPEVAQMWKERFQ